MANVKDVTKEKQAMNVNDVNNQDARTRLWQSLNTTYSNQMDESDKAYDKAISQQNNSMLAKGMGRSSYAGAISALMGVEKANARNKLGQALIADYQNRIGDIENQEKEDERWERQFAETKKQNEWQRKYQEGEAARAQSNWEQEYAANRSDTAWNQGFQQSEANRQQSNWEIQQAFNEKQWEDQKAQWREEYDFNKMTSDQKIGFEIITAALEAGKDADDATLKRAGISRAEFNTMKQNAAATGSGGTAYWRSLGFASEKDYSAARKLGMNADQYKAYLAGQNGSGNGGNTSGGLVSDLNNYSTKNHADTMLSSNALLNSATGTVRAMTDSDKKKTNSGK